MKSELDEFFIFKAKKGLERRLTELKYKVDEKVYQDRLDYEIEIILSTNFRDYFFVVSDFLHWARSNGVRVGPGRGSVAGSLVAYCMGITNIDPIKYELYFERFLNPERITPPDADCDFDKEKRNLVIDYVKKKYGEDKVAQIGTFGTFKAKASIRAIARTLGYPIPTADALCKMYPKPIHGKDIPLKKAIEQVDIFKDYYADKSSPEGQILRWAEKVEGRIASFGIHPSGVIIGRESLYKTLPLAKGRNGEVVSQWDMGRVEDVGLIKFDFLGLKALTLISKSLENIKERHGIDIDIDNIDLDDPETYQSLRDGDTCGVFQLEASTGMQDLLVKIRPTNIEDITALIAAYRPGPLCLGEDTQILTEIKRAKNKKREFRYKKIKDIKQDDILISLDENSLTLIKNKVVNTFLSGQKEVFKINIQTGLTSTNRSYIPSNLKSKRKTDFIEATLNHKFLTLEGWKELKDIVPGEYLCITHHSGYGTVRTKNIPGRKNFKNIAFRHYQYRCVYCDWDKGSLDVNHVEHNRFKDNSQENLSFLCPNHHREFSEGTITKEGLVKEREKYRLPFAEEIMYVKYLGKESIGVKTTYDLEMTTPYNNFIAGDFIVHNSSPKLHDYLEVRAGTAKATYHHPDLEPSLKATSGWLIYQEQLLRIARDLAGYSLGEADLLRRAVGKKKEKEMKEQEQKFKEGMRTNGYDQKLANKLWEEFLAFADYGFNKGHAAAYAIIVYQTAWLKKHYPVEYMCACLTCDMGNADQMMIYLSECKRMRIKVLPPDINLSQSLFSITGDDEIRFGLSAIKNLGEEPVSSIIEARSTGNFASFFNFAERVDLGKINKTKIESLLLAGAFDTFGDTRATLLTGVESVLNHKAEVKRYLSKTETYNKKTAACVERLKEIQTGSKAKPLKAPDLPSVPEVPRALPVPEMPKRDVLKYEKELTGFYMSGHPLDPYERVVKATGFTIQKLKEDESQPKHAELVGVINSIKTRETKSTKQIMASATFEDKTGTIGLTLFPNMWNRFGTHLVGNQVIKVVGEIDYIDGESGTIPSTIKVKSLDILPILEDETSKTIELTIPLDEKIVSKVNDLLERYSGSHRRVQLSFRNSDGSVLKADKIFLINNQDTSFKSEVYKIIHSK